MLTIVAANTEVPPVSQAAAAKVAREIAALEASIDQSIAHAAALAATIVDTRRDSGLPVHAGQLALIRLQRAQAQLVAASSDTFRVHDELSRLARTLMIWEDPTEPSGLLDDNQALDAVA
ncbi:hypothetical protein [Novosphingobium sp. Gsoil 351]|uniref:hypothetical protein n=1 Tax=Novosphingobium sp. Gsoil 351 TaxID=2675225 RepID=UPI0012B45DB6|nr:hypothetical protein [Novosphingobium sp. Gsoil 351]QGN54244.1 hypothetical protein GKE62_06470 [Novosphingobium sp. Gsoil 351]